MTTLSPPPEIVVRRRLDLRRDALALWSARGLLGTLVERDVRARYRRALLGVVWTAVHPLALTIVLTVFASRAVKSPPGVPYPVFALAGLLPWSFFSATVLRGGQALLQNGSLVAKIACPREVFPLSAVAVAALDALVPASILGVIIVGLGPEIGAGNVMLLLPLAAVHLSFTIGVTLVVSATLVHLRDLRHALPVAIQLMLLASPVAYTVDGVNASVRTTLAAANPLVATIDGFRGVLLTGTPSVEALPAAAFASVVWLVGGYLLFKWLEPGMADVG